MDFLCGKGFAIMCPAKITEGFIAFVPLGLWDKVFCCRRFVVLRLRLVCRGVVVATTATAGGEQGKGSDGGQDVVLHGALWGLVGMLPQRGVGSLSDFAAVYSLHTPERSMCMYSYPFCISCHFVFLSAEERVFFCGLLYEIQMKPAINALSPPIAPLYNTRRSHRGVGAAG